MYILFSVISGSSTLKVVTIISGGQESVLGYLRRKMSTYTFLPAEDGNFRSEDGSFLLQPAPLCEPWFGDGTGVAVIEQIEPLLAMA